MGADCKSVGLRLPRFESWICHQHQDSTVWDPIDFYRGRVPVGQRDLPGWLVLVSSYRRADLPETMRGLGVLVLNMSSTEWQCRTSRSAFRHPKCALNWNYRRRPIARPEKLFHRFYFANKHEQQEIVNLLSGFHRFASGPQVIRPYRRRTS